MWRRHSSCTAVFAFACIAVLALPVLAQEGSSDVPKALRDQIEMVAELTGADQVLGYREIRTLLDGIVRDDPASDLAADIVLRRPVAGLDLAAMNAALREARDARSAARRASTVSVLRGAVEASNEAAAVPEDGSTRNPASPSGATEETASATDEAATAPTATDIISASEVPATISGLETTSQPALAPGTEATETALALDRQAIRDLQARLLVSGHDPNGIDGRIGRGTRSAIAGWQAAQGTEPTGYLHADQIAALGATSQLALDAWLSNQANARSYAPPAPIALTPGRVAGTWDTVTRCGRNSRVGQRTIRSTMSVVHRGGDRYDGRIANSLGFRGDVSMRIRGRVLEGTVNWGLLVGRGGFKGRIADQSLTAAGSDTDGCSFSAVKR